MPKENPLPQQKILLVGVGKMGRALLDGWLAAGITPPQFNIIEPNPDEDLRKMDIHIGAPSAPVDIIVLAVKPQMAEQVAPTLRAYIKDETLILSILAGTPTQKLEALLQHNIQIRAMPNTPASIGQGITALYANAQVSAAHRNAAQVLMAALGEVVWLEEEGLIDAATAISGSGPAYIFYMAEVLAANGVRLGLPPPLAAKLSYQMIKGAGAMLIGADDASTLRQNVTSPNGTTEAALEILMPELPDLMKKTILAAYQRAKILSQDAPSNGDGDVGA